MVGVRIERIVRSLYAIAKTLNPKQHGPLRLIPNCFMGNVT